MPGEVLPEGGGFRDKNLTLQVALKIDETSNDQTAMSTPVFLKEPDQHQSSSIVLSCSIPQDQRHGKINLQLVWDSTQRIVTVFAPIWFVDASGLNVRASSKGKVLLKPVKIQEPAIDVCAGRCLARVSKG